VRINEALHLNLKEYLPKEVLSFDGGGAENPRYEFIPSELKNHVKLYGCEENS
jgi:hypothetical protein